MRCTVALRWLISAKPFVGVAVDQLGRARRRLAQDAEPGERVLAEVAAGREPVTAARTTLREPSAPTTKSASISSGAARRHPTAIDARAVGLGILDALGGDAEAEVLAGGEARGDEVLQHLVLRVEPDAAADERREVDAVTLAGEAQLDAVVAVPDGAHAG